MSNYPNYRLSAATSVSQGTETLTCSKPNCWPKLPRRRGSPSRGTALLSLRITLASPGGSVLTTDPKATPCAPPLRPPVQPAGGSVQRQPACSPLPSASVHSQRPVPPGPPSSSRAGLHCLLGPRAASRAFPSAPLAPHSSPPPLTPNFSWAGHRGTLLTPETHRTSPDSSHPLPTLRGNTRPRPRLPCSFPDGSGLGASACAGPPRSRAPCLPPPLGRQYPVPASPRAAAAASRPAP